MPQSSPPAPAQTSNGFASTEPVSSGAAAPVESARRVLAVESAALLKLSDSLGTDYEAAVRLMAECRGRVIVSGMGKSGHVGNKLAATLASTGTPAFAVHPGEASHGDLGMITEQDVLVLLSNSGETHELTDILAYAHRFAIPVIGMTGRPDSTLGKGATVALILPNLEEACPMGLAPTTSTTAMLALGDCLAVSLLEQRGFTSEDFHIFHPGGKLGAGLKRVEDIMFGKTDLPTCQPTTSMSDALIIMSSQSFGVVAVLGGDGQLDGVITDGDLRRHMAPDLLEKRACDVMTSEPKTISASALIGDAVHLMNQHKIGNLFVVNDLQRVVGIIRLHDCLRAGAA